MDYTTLEFLDTRTDGQTDGWMNRWTDGTDGWKREVSKSKQ